MAVAEDLRPTATVAEVKAISTAEGLICSFLSFFSKMEAEMFFFSLHKCHLRNVNYDSIIPINKDRPPF